MRLLSFKAILRQECEYFGECCYRENECEYFGECCYREYECEYCMHGSAAIPTPILPVTILGTCTIPIHRSGKSSNALAKQQSRATQNSIARSLAS